MENKINSRKVLYNKIGDDENYTPAYGVEPIIKHIENYMNGKGFMYDRNLIVWCPFDAENSEYVKLISTIPFVTVVKSHIKHLGRLKSLEWTCEPKRLDIIDFHYQLMEFSHLSLGTKFIGGGKDFFEYEPREWDIIVSNPPFKKKRLFIEKALSFDKPFALLMTLACYNDKYPAWSFYEKDRTLQLLKFDKRIKFTNPSGRPNNKITFQSGYMCCNFLKEDSIMEELKGAK